ncbi:hypothetical protein [Mycobacterium aquaticum]|nr:hypothetical protein [Mycobacterium aquaticum]
MRTILGVAIGTIAFWLAMLAAVAAYILEHIFAIGLATALVATVILASRLLLRRQGQRTRARPAAINVGRTAGIPPAASAHMRKAV